MPGKKILMLTGEFTEEYEIFVFEQGMEAVGHTVHVVCPDKKAGDKIQTSLHDFEGHQTYTEKLRPLRRHQQDLLRGEARRLRRGLLRRRPRPGVHPHRQAGAGRWSGTSTRPASRSSPSATACRSSIAVDGVVKGKRVAALGACEPEVRLAGGTYVDLSPTESLIDGNMVSAKGWTALAAFMRDCLKVLGTEIRHGEIRTPRGDGGRVAPATGAH